MIISFISTDKTNLIDGWYELVISMIDSINQNQRRNPIKN